MDYIDSLHLYYFDSTLLQVKEPEEKFSNLSVSISTKDTVYIIQLLNDKFQTLNSCTNCKSLTFKYIEPGTYYLRAIIDTDRNGLHTQGNPFTLNQPEEIIYFKDPIKLRANWSIEDLLFTF